MRVYVLTIESRSGGKLAKALQVLQIMDILEEAKIECEVREG